MTPVPRKHKWRRHEDGEIDIFAYDGDTHNGPACEACGEGFCEHCEGARMAAVLAGTDPADCVDWHNCPLPVAMRSGERWTCPEPDCGKAYEAKAYWAEAN